MSDALLLAQQLEMLERRVAELEARPTSTDAFIERVGNAIGERISARLAAMLEQKLDAQLRKTPNSPPSAPQSGKPYTANGTLWGHNET